MFALESKFYRFCEILYKIIVLNLLFLLTSLPIFTFATSFSAMMQVFRQEKPQLIASYFHYFKKSLLKTLPIGVFNSFSFCFFLMLETTVQTSDSLWLKFVFIIFSAFLVTYNLTIYLVQRDTKNLKDYFQLFRQAFGLSLLFFYKSLLILIITGGLYYVSYPFVGVLINLTLVGAPMYFYQKSFYRWLVKLS